MKNLIIIIMLISISGFAQNQTAVTDTGKKVLLYENGTWKYTDNSMTLKEKIKVNSEEFSKAESNNFLLKSKKFNVGFWIDPVNWTISNSNDNGAVEYKLNHKKHDIHAVIITEGFGIPLSSMREIALANGKKAGAPDMRIVKEEYRIINGIKVLNLELNGTLYGIQFTYVGYYYSTKDGVVQYVLFSQETIVDKYRSEIYGVLNGLVEIK